MQARTQSAHARMHTRTLKRMHARMHARTHSSTHTCTHARSHTHTPAGPLNYDDANGDFTEWLQTHNQPLKVSNHRGQLDLVYVCHGIFSTHLGPICDALGIERPPPADLAKRKISQADLRVFVETSRRLFRAACVVVVAWLAGSFLVGAAARIAERVP